MNETILSARGVVRMVADISFTNEEKKLIPYFKNYVQVAKEESKETTILEVNSSIDFTSAIDKTGLLQIGLRSNSQGIKLALRGVQLD